jgi:hypothetical protein
LTRIFVIFCSLRAQFLDGSGDLDAAGLDGGVVRGEILHAAGDGLRDLKQGFEFRSGGF